MPFILQVTGIKLQLLFAFIVLSVITLTALLLILLSKNTRSAKVRELAHDHHWQYQEFIDIDSLIKAANFGVLNYSQNVIFRHAISAKELTNSSTHTLGFYFFDCRAVEVFGVHNSSIVLFNLHIHDHYLPLQCSIMPNAQPATGHNPMQSSDNTDNKTRILNQQKLSKIPAHHQFEKHTLHANQPALLADFLNETPCSPTPQAPTEKTRSAIKNNAYWLNNWLLAHPHLHIEISNGMLLAYQPNHLLADDLILPAIEAVAALSNQLSNM